MTKLRRANREKKRKVKLISDTLHNKTHHRARQGTPASARLTLVCCCGDGRSSNSPVTLFLAAKLRMQIFRRSISLLRYGILSYAAASSFESPNNSRWGAPRSKLIKAAATIFSVSRGSVMSTWRLFHDRCSVESKRFDGAYNLICKVVGAWKHTRTRYLFSRRFNEKKNPEFRENLINRASLDENLIFREKKSPLDPLTSENNRRVCIRRNKKMSDLCTDEIFSPTREEGRFHF